MFRMAACIVLWVGIATQSSTLLAAEPNVLLPLAERYQAAVHQFEKLVLQVRGIDRADERWVDRLDDAAIKLRLAAKNPRHLNRVFYRWQETQKLHAQVEQRLFGKYTPNHELIYGWDAVNYHYSLFAEEFVYHVENPRHGGSVRKLEFSNSQRNRYLGSPTWTPTFTPALRPSLIPSTSNIAPQPGSN